MACLEIECTRCHWSTFENHDVEKCPKCGADTLIMYDEADDHNDVAD